MTELKARATRFDLANTPMHWIPDDPQSTHFWNVLHVALPPGERWFCEVFRDAAPHVNDPEVAGMVRGFIGQETTHAKAHDKGLDFLAEHGVDLRVDVARADKLATRLHKFGQRMPRPVARYILNGELAAIAGIEHYTSVLGDWFVQSRDIDETGADPVMVDLIRWHASEEVEHRNVAFDVYQEVSGNYVRRVIVGTFVTLGLFLGFPLINAVLMLRDKSTKERFKIRRLFKPKTKGAIFDIKWALSTFSDYLKRDYHPSHYGNYDAAIAYLNYSPGVVRKAS